ncbi:MAG: proline dehydrogenase [Gammaproteobacteria bacterium]|nr:proline dehydrogenase [Gammaproteobacteria bacterium]|tara:strand:+ start:13985 stop:17071 length:3087 start_codon:yes stop_codon:yes gene_type:complete
MSTETYFKDLQKLKYRDETSLVSDLIQNHDWINEKLISQNAEEIVKNCREDRNKTRLDNFFLEYGLSNQEGIALMCLAESLLRIPDNETCDEIIEEKIGGKKWLAHFNSSPSLFVNATTFGLFLAEQVVELDKKISANPISWFQGLTSRLGDPILREAIKKGMEILSEEFVSGIDIDDALNKFDHPKVPCSFDMLGEAARTQSDVDFFFNAYEEAIRKVGEKNALLSKSFHEISIKLSAIHPRYEATKKERVMDELLERVYQLCIQSAAHDIALTIDAEEQDRLELSLHLIENLANRKDLKDWSGLGLAIQAYGKRAPVVVKFIDELGANRNGMMMRLVKGAYWDQEVKIHQVKGAADLPVFTSKSFTDLNYLSTAKIISETKNLRPYFATHNAHTIAGIMHLYKGREDQFEFQRIFGMGDLTYRNAKKVYSDFPLTRVYAPVGSKKELLPYLVRRLLENGANSSFVNKYLSKDIPVKEVVKNPIEIATKNLSGKKFLKQVPRPNKIFSDRENSQGFDFGDLLEIENLSSNIAAFNNNEFYACSLLNGEEIIDTYEDKFSPSDQSKKIGRVSYLSKDNLSKINLNSNDEWSESSVENRIEVLKKTAQLLEKNSNLFYALLINEAGKSLKDCDAEIRESIDFINYYCLQASKIFTTTELESPSGERNFLSVAPKGSFLCISPWNFPMAIFIGQIVAALVTGNKVLAKPAEDTSLIAFQIVKLFHEAGVPESVLELIIGGKDIGNELTKFNELNGVAFTGSTAAAKSINLNLAKSEGPIKTLIAETGGQNAMFVDSSSLKEQVIDDVIRSAFYSSGQRCSALRIVFVQEDIAQEYWEYLNEAMQEIKVGDPQKPCTDIGPIINKTSLSKLQDHVAKLKKAGKEFIETKGDLSKETFFMNPIAFKIDSIKEIDGEKFGPILHFISYKSSELDGIINEINATGFGLTMGVHSRVLEKAKQIFDKANVGNFYLNRDIVGAVVGVQPFGGQGLSGTGPKAGGPNYLHSFITEKTFTDNVMATGGNIDLLTKNNE